MFEPKYRLPCNTCNDKTRQLKYVCSFRVHPSNLFLCNLLPMLSHMLTRHAVQLKIHVHFITPVHSAFSLCICRLTSFETNCEKLDSERYSWAPFEPFKVSILFYNETFEFLNNFTYVYNDGYIYVAVEVKTKRYTLQILHSMERLSLDNTK